MDTISDFKTRFNYALSHRNMKPVELSERTGISKSTISHYMSGYTKPKTDKLYILAKALNVNEAWLIGYNIAMERTEEDQNILRFDAELDHALNIIEDSEYSWNYSMAPDYDIIIKDSSNEIISCIHDYELVNIYESLQKKNNLTVRSLISNLEHFFLSADEKEHIKKYRFISEHSPESADMIDMAIDKGYSIAKQISDQRKHIDQLKQSIVCELIKRIPLPFYAGLASAGSGEYLFDDIPMDVIEVPDTPISRKADFIIGVNGDSMEPDFYNGEKVFVKKTTNLSTGDIGIFLKGGDCYIKELGKDRLISHNPDKDRYPDVEADEDIIIVGKVIGKVEE